METATSPELNLSTMPAAAAVDADLPQDVRATIDAWRGFKEAVNAYWQQFLALRAAEKDARGLRDNSEDYLLVMCEHDAAISVSKIAENVCSNLVRAAEKTFSPAGACLDIRLPGKDRLPAVDSKQFDPVAIWEYLSNTYGGSAGARTAYTAAARHLRSDLMIRPGMEPRMVGGRVVFEARVYPDKELGRIIGFRDREDLNRILDGFLAVAEWSGCWEGHEKLHIRWARGDIELADFHKTLPGRREIGDSVVIVPFKSKWEYRIAPAFAEKMQMFLAEFGAFESSGY